MIRLPKNQVLTQPNIGETNGDIWSSFGLDVSRKLGLLMVGQRYLTSQTSVASSTDFNGSPVAFSFFARSGGVLFWCMAGDNIFFHYGIDFTVPFVKIDTGDSAVTYTDTAPTQYDHTVGDMAVYDDKIWHTTLRDIAYIPESGNGSLFGGDNPLQFTFVHMLTPFGSRLYITDENTKVLSTDGSTLATSGSNTLNLASNNVDDGLRIITDTVPTGDYLWVLTLNQAGKLGKVFRWDGVTENVSKGYIIDAPGAIAGIALGDVLHIVTNDGRLMAFNGGTFVEVARFPVDMRKPLKNSLSAINNRWIHPNGIDVFEDKIQFIINGQYEDGTYDERLPSGIWEYNPLTKSIYHKHPLSLSTSATNADFGQLRLYEAGALYNVKYYTRTTSNGNSFAGCSYYSDATTSTPAVLYDDTLQTKQKVGVLITPKFISSALKDQWKKFYIAHRELLDSADRIIVKYRTKEQDPQEETITWTGGSSFSTTEDISGYALGDEVEITAGTGAGLSAHITAMQTIDGVTYVDIDGTANQTSGTAKARFQKWIKSGVETTDQIDDLHNYSIGEMTTWVQLKIFLLITGEGEIEKMLLNNEPQQLTD